MSFNIIVIRCHFSFRSKHYSGDQQPQEYFLENIKYFVLRLSTDNTQQSALSDGRCAASSLLWERSGEREVFLAENFSPVPAAREILFDCAAVQVQGHGGGGPGRAPGRAATPEFAAPGRQSLRTCAARQTCWQSLRPWYCDSSYRRTVSTLHRRHGGRGGQSELDSQRNFTERLVFQLPRWVKHQLRQRLTPSPSEQSDFCKTLDNLTTH